MAHPRGPHSLTGNQIKDAVGNEYGRPKDIAGETRMAFTSHADAAFDVCFENQLTPTGASITPPHVLPYSPTPVPNNS